MWLHLRIAVLFLSLTALPALAETMAARYPNLHQLSGRVAKAEHDVIQLTRTWVRLAQWPTVLLAARDIAGQVTPMPGLLRSQLVFIQQRLSPTPSAPLTDPTTALNLTPVAGQALPAGDDALFYLAQPQAPVVAIAPGTVAFAGPFQNLGGLVITETPDHAHTVYAGLGLVQVGVGTVVQPGTPLGQLPDTPAPRLYVEHRAPGV